MSNLEAAQADFAKKDKRLRYGVGLLFAYVVILLSFVAVMTLITQTTIERNQRINAAASEQRFSRYVAQNEKQHQITQAYIKCIAQVLLVPIDARQAGAFDSCGVTAKQLSAENGGSDDTSFLAPQSSSTQSATVPSTPANSNQTPAAPPAQQPTTSSPPPDPEQTPAISIVTPLLPEPICVLGLLCVQ